MVVHVAFVDDADDDVAAVGAAGLGPDFTGAAAVLVGRRGVVAVHAPEAAVGVVGVVGDGGVLQDPVRLGEIDGAVGLQFGDGVAQGAAAHVQQLDVAADIDAAVAAGQRLGAVAVDAAHDALLVALAGAGAELHDQLVGDVGAAFGQALGHEVGTAAGHGGRGGAKGGQGGGGEQGGTECGLHWYTTPQLDKPVQDRTGPADPTGAVMPASFCDAAHTFDAQS